MGEDRAVEGNPRKLAGPCDGTFARDREKSARRGGS